MNKFILPDIEVVNDMDEGVYAGSGAFDNSQGDDTQPGSSGGGGGTAGHARCWINWQCRWTGHNNGGHSVCNVTASHCGDHSGNCLVMNFATNFPISDVKNASGLTISNIGTYSFTLTRNNFFNAGDNIGFNFEIVVSPELLLTDEAGNPLHGAIGTKNAAAYYCKVTSYQCG